jgi:ubiquinone/menaquinone biosynthesis C-methylase UbiE
MKAADSMRRDWNERAKRDAFHYIASWRKDWDEASFFESGEQDFARLVQPVLEKLRFDAEGKSMAEVGCGAGRMTRAFAKRFGTVAAVDISAEMQERAKEYLRDFQNIRWVQSDGASLGGIETGSVDFVFSYLVLQHFPSRDVALGTIREMVRVLRPGGAFLFQYNGTRRPTMNWKGQMLSGALDTLWALGLKKASRGLAARAGVDPEMIGHTWRGVSLNSGEVASAAREAGSDAADFLAEDTPLAWCYGRKSGGSGAC